ncbi:hypothetical protein CK203_060713 [Vitis vinifera]|uniref:Uncharacterized protein n=1 Tax=Vitis vinifera TaxID=29760 RepID=A0A438GCA5_VITVI|nr:hypothetical protein CK203_060713 [Vitis vinifera]
MLENDIRVATQQVLVTSRLAKNDNAGSSKPSKQLRQVDKGSLHYLVEKLIRVGHLKQYIRSIGGQRKTTWDLAIQAPITPTAPKVFINYIHEGPVDEKYNSKRKRQRMLQATFVREQVSFIQHSCQVGHEGHPSTYHQMVSYFIEDEHIDLFGNQLVVTASAIKWRLSPDSPAANKDIFTWTHSDMLEIHPSIVSHRLNREVEYPDWLANVVVVPIKEENGDSVFITPTDACSKDSFPLPPNRSNS